jgi:orotate phosphoribosyltransferase
LSTRPLYHRLETGPGTSGRLLARIYEQAFFLASDRPVYRYDGSLARWALDVRIPMSSGATLRPAVRWFRRRMAERGLRQVAGRGYGSFLIVGGIVAADGGITGLLIRDRRKAYGFREILEGSRRGGREVMVVDDILSSGRTMQRTIDSLREAGFVPTVAATVFEFAWRKGRARLESEGIEVLSMAKLWYRHSSPRVTWESSALDAGE